MWIEIFRVYYGTVNSASNNSCTEIMDYRVNTPPFFYGNVNTLQHQRKGLLYETDPPWRPLLSLFLFIGLSLAASLPRYSYANTGLPVSLVTLSMVFKLLEASLMTS